MKTRHSYLTLCVAASLYVPQAFSDASQTMLQPSRNTNAAGSDSGGISGIYSDMDMRMRLASKPNEKACTGDVCVSNQVFDAQVQLLGLHLAQSAYAVYPDLKKKIPNFVFGVADKKVVGSASNAKGAVIMFRGLQHLDLGEEATAFIVAREMGHVIANHHKSNAKTKIFFTVLASVLFPAVSILSASGAAAQATTATTLLTSAASTATSYVGSEVALSRIKPTQLSEADDIAIKLLESEGWSKSDIAQALEYIGENENASAWEKDLYQSTHYVRKIADEASASTAQTTELESLPEAYVVVEASTGAAIEAVKHSEKPPVNLPPVVQTAQPTQKLVEQHKSILITNETIAESHRYAGNVSEKLEVKAPTKPQSVKKAVKNANPSKIATEKKYSKKSAKTKQKLGKETIRSSSKSTLKKSLTSNPKAATKAASKLPRKSKLHTAKK